MWATLVTPFRTRLRRRHLRRSLALRRAWQQVMDGPDPDAVTRRVSQLSLVRISIPRGLLRLSGLEPRLDAAVETTVRQVLLIGLYAKLQPGLMLLATGRSAGLPIPAEWRAHLRAQGIAVDPTGSAIAHAWEGLLGLARGARRILRSLRQPPDALSRIAHVQPYDVAVQLPASFLRPMPADPATSFRSWLQREAPAGGVWLHCDVPTAASQTDRIIASPLPRLPNPHARLSFTLCALRLSLGAAAGILIGRPELACILPETILLAHAKCLEPKSLARTYIFENSRWFLRPLFTRWARLEAGSSAVLAFYSTNNDEALRLGPTSREACFIPGYQSMDWDGYVVWDQHQAALVRAWGHDHADIRIAGPIPLTDSITSLPDIPVRSLAVFDVAPFGPARLAAMGLVPEYYRDGIAAQFIDDLRELSSSLGLTLVLKQKRERKRIGPPRYEAAVRRLLEAPNAIVLDPQISAARVTTLCAATLSMPFSSPAVIAAHQGKPAAFYDPTGRLIASHRQSHGLPVIAGRDALQTWLGKVF
jgi:hypothetical protein